MIEYNINQINKIINGKVIGNKNISIKNISIDSRTIYSAKDSVFFALQGKNNDGHKYISSLIESGVKVFVVNRIENKWLKNNRVSFIQVQDTLKALQEFAAFHRKQFSYPVISITGSNGKTIIKEWLYQVLYYDYQIVRSPKSYNSQVGVPLSVLLMDKNYNLAIFEAGISQTGEMEKLEKILKPTIGVFTNIGEAHQENFKSIKQKTEEKIKLFQSSEKIIYCKNYKLIHECICNTYPQKIKISWSFKNDSDLYINEIIKENEKTRITGIYKKEKIKIEIPFTDNASLENAIHVWLLLLEMNYNHQIIAEHMNSLHPIGMRLELKEGINNCSIINDAYNSDLNSLTIALDFLNQQNKNSKKTLILSDIMQSGKKENELYQTVSDLLIKKNIDKFIGIGPSLKRNSSLFFKKSTFFESTGEFLNNYSKNNFNNEDILIKGSRDFKFENISAFLEYKGHRTILEINLNALVHNLNFFKSQLKSTTKIMVMVKAFSYGSGLYEIANLLQYNRVNYLGVAFIDEGILLRKSGIKTPIMVMHPEERGYENLIEYHLEPEIFNCEILEKFHTVLENKNINNYPVHIKIDTGMHRLGFNTEEIEKLIRKIKQCSRIKIKSVFSHLAASDEVVHDNFTKEQILRFEKVKTYFSKEFSYSIIYHILNSEGILRFTSAQFDMVRIGIGLYGISYSQQHNLVNVSTLKSRILQIKLVKKGETIGYGRRGLAEKNMKIGIVPIGYADGLSRNLSNGVGSFYINGKYSPIIGNICMDVCMIDITGIEVNTGDEVIIFGEENPIIKIAQKINTIPYEILTSISGRVKRIYYHE